MLWVSTEAKEGGLCHVCSHCVAVEELLLTGHTLCILGAWLPCLYSEGGMGAIPPAAHLTFLLRDFHDIMTSKATSASECVCVAWEGDQEDSRGGSTHFPGVHSATRG